MAKVSGKSPAKRFTKTEVYRSGAAAFFSKPPLLRTENRREFDGLHLTLRRETKPNHTIEAAYVFELAYTLWEMRRLRRMKAAIINLAFRVAVKSILSKVARTPPTLRPPSPLPLDPNMDPGINE